jgi:hypothetical protein
MSDKNFKVKNGVSIGDSAQITVNSETNKVEVSTDSGVTKSPVATLADLPDINPMFFIGGV